MIDIPPITDEAIHEVCKLLALPQHAFHGLNGNDPRHEVLKSMDTIDIEACPGSGKTTLLVAKLALLAKRWPYRTRGICVLSHTNGARDEIEKKLGSTVEGQALLKYPHYIGTIHGFVNEFVVSPYLRSKGIPINIIENEICYRFIEDGIWKTQGLSNAAKRKFAQQNIRNKKKFTQLNWEYINGALKVSPQFILANMKGFDQNTSLNDVISFQTKLKLSATKIGKHTFDDSFAFAMRCCDKYPVVKKSIRQRFPMHFIDEAQDNSEDQSATLYEIFMEGGSSVTRQRFGDSNQSIYNRTGQSGAITDAFPSEQNGVKKELPNSHRFGSEIALLANNFAINRLEAGLQGHGPNTSKANAVTNQKHTIFLFKDGEIDKVLPEYAKHILEVFADDPEGLKQGDFVAVGAVHTKPDKPQNPPHYIGHYYPDYKSELSKKEPSPKNFPEYIMVGKYLSSLSHSSYLLVDKYSEALLKAAHIAGGKWSASRRKRKHNYILETLMEAQEIADLHKAQILKLIKNDINLTKPIWEEGWVKDINSIVRTLVGDDVEMDKMAQFLTWPDEMMELPISSDSSVTSNHFHYPSQETSDISIRLGSIHSIKGQNHTATLVLDTFNKTYHLQKLKDWVLGKNRTRKQINDQSDRLKLHYVAVTRPTHLLCLAMRHESFTQKEIVSLEAGTRWNIKVL